MFSGGTKGNSRGRSNSDLWQAYDGSPDSVAVAFATV